MRNTIKYERRKFLIEESDGKHIKRSSVDMHKFYDRWHEEITVARTVADFDYRFEDQSVHIKWLKLTVFGGEICERVFYLDKSVTSKPLALRIFSRLEQDFKKTKDEFLESLLDVMSRLTEQEEMNSLISKIMGEYSKNWSIDSLDKQDLFRVVNYIKKHGYKNGNIWATPIEKGVIFVLLGYAFTFLINILPTPLSKVIFSGALQEIYGPLINASLCIGLMKAVFSYVDACNERSMNDLLEEFEETFGEEYKIYQISGKTIEDMRVIIEEIFNHMKEHAEVLGDDREQDIADREETMLSHSNFNLKERFDHLRGILEIERELYKEGYSIGGPKCYINGGLSSEDLVRRLIYVDYKGEDLRLVDVFDVLLSIEKNPYYGCEDDILDLYSLAIEHVYLVTKYRPQIYDASFEYETLLKKKREVFARIVDHQRIAKRYACLPNVRDSRGSIKFKPVG